MGALGDAATHAGLRGVCLVSRETLEPGSTTHSRFFAPHYGIPEDIVTGSVHSSIGLWLLEAGLPRPPRTPVRLSRGEGAGAPRPRRHGTLEPLRTLPRLDPQPATLPRPRRLHRGPALGLSP